MKKFSALLLVALVGATVASIRWDAVPLDDRLVRIKADSAYPALAAALADEPTDVLTTLLAYRGDEVLRLKAQAAVLEHPRLARKILPLYGLEPEFRTILRSYGSGVLLPIDHFLDNEIGLLAAREYASRKAAAAKGAATHWWRSMTSSASGKQPAESDTAADAADAAGAASAAPGAPAGAKAAGEMPTPEQRGWYAVHFIAEEGHDFLGQFALDAEGRTQWIQTERFLEGFSWLLASGVRTLETKARTDETIDAADIGWAALDAAAFVGAAYLLRAGKAATNSARAARAASVSGRAVGWGARAAKAAQAGFQTLRIAKWPAIVATAYVVVRHPSLVTSALAGVADLVGLPVLLVQVLGWTAILLPLFVLAWWITLAASWALARIRRTALRSSRARDHPGEARSASCSTRHRIFPVADRGSASTNSTMRGALYAAITSCAQSTISSAPTRPRIASRSTTTAFTVSPR